MTSESSKSSDIELVAEEITKYLQQHQFAADTVEGICDWWIAKQRIQEEQTRVIAALGYLIETGAVSQRRLPDGSLIYTAGQGALQATLLEKNTDKGKKDN